MGTPDVERIEKRLGALERENRAFRAAALAVVVMLYWFWFIPAQHEPDRGLVKEKFVLRDQKGTLRAELGMRAGGPALWLFDEAGMLRVSLGMGKDGPGFRLYDEGGKTRVGLAVETKGPTIFLYDEAGKVIWKSP